MVSSLDGATAIDGRSGGLSSTTDHELLLGLRSLADVVLVGASTVRSEGYGVPRKAGLRIGVVTLTTRRIDWSLPLFESGAGFVITTEDAPAVPVDSVRAGVGQIDLAQALTNLDAGFVHCEGGPTLNGSLLEADLVDEINLTMSPHLIGGESSRVAAGATEALRRMVLAQLLEEDGFLFSRYLRAER